MVNLGFFGHPSRDAFAQKFIEELRRGSDPRQVQYDATGFRLRFSFQGQDAGTIYLEREYEDYLKASRWTRKKFLTWAALRAMYRHWKLPDDRRSALPNLLPEIWFRATLEQQKLRAKLGFPVDTPSDHTGGSLKPLTDDMFVGVSYRLPIGSRDLTDDELAGWSLGFEEALEIAIGNTASDDAQIHELADSPGLFATVGEAELRAVKILRTDVIRELPLQGEPIAIIPTKHNAIVTGTRNAAGLLFMQKMVLLGIDDVAVAHPARLYGAGDAP